MKNHKKSRFLSIFLCIVMLLGMLPSASASAAQTTPEETTPMYRLYNPNSGEHFYTGSLQEKDMLVSVGWNYEGVAWDAPVASGDPVYRMYNPNSGDHHYTMSADERDNLVAVGWQYEGVCWNSAPADQVPLYRLYNPNADCGSHHYTNSADERDWLVSLGWILEGIGWFGITPPPPTVTITLSATHDEMVVGEATTVYFYANLSHAAENVVLMDANNDCVLIELMDDGMYSTSGDDLPNDNIYSGVLTFHLDEEISFNFYAVANAYDQEHVSNSVQINAITGFTPEEVEQMETVELSFQTDVFATDGYEEMTVEQRKDVAEDVLNNLVEQGLIDSDSIFYDVNTASYSFLYSSGASGVLLLKDWNEEQNGLANNTVQRVNSVQHSVTQQVSNAVPAPLAANLTTNSVQIPEVGEAIVLWSFDQYWDDPDFRIPFYEELEVELDSMGLETTIDWDATVEDYKDLAGYEVIMFSGHGVYTTYVVKTGTYSKDTQTVPSLVLSEEATSDKDQLYVADLKQFRIGKLSLDGGTKYAILPDFFNYYYDNNDLSGSFIFAENCEFRGKENVSNSVFVDTLLSRSAEAVVGFHNSVMAVYSRDLMKTYITELLDGSTAYEAFEQAMADHGSTDYFEGREQYGPTAYPLFGGDASAMLVKKDIVNGDFEDADTPQGWKQIGDTRVINKLGPLSPTSQQKMAILSTGIGSAEEEYLSGTEGSILSQVFTIPENRSHLKFTYNVVSEEPLEYVDSSFNDTFLAQLVVGDGTVLMASEDVNTSTWTTVSDIDFEDGDDTTYQTCWKTVDYDVSAYAGQTVTLQFVIYDMGDSIFDTAALIDNVYLY